MNTTPYTADLVLIGGGHSHLSVIKSFAMNPVQGLRITLISRDIHTPYSGMLPSLLAGHYNLDETHIDLRSLCEKANIRLFQSEVTNINLELQKIHCNSRIPIRYDWLSINIGSEPDLKSIDGAGNLGLAVKPVPQFLGKWQTLLKTIAGQHNTAAHKINIVGGGAASIEVALATHRQLEKLNLSDKVQLKIVCSTPQILPTHNHRVQKSIATILANKNIETLKNHKVKSVSLNNTQTNMVFSDNTQSSCDTVIWAIHAACPSWIKPTGLQCDQNGFITVNQFLQSSSHSNVFAAGDIANFEPGPLPKSGVYAVRAGVVLAENIRRAVNQRPLKAYHPQRSFLSLLMTGNKSAIASKSIFSFSGKWVWRWKDHIDRKFVKQYSHWNPMQSSKLKQDKLGVKEEMRCGGCGAKVGSQILARVMSQLKPLKNSDVIIGLDHPDDAAVIVPPENKQWLQTVDYFRAFIDDPYLLGRIATNHCLSDIYAMGAIPHSALALATVPYGSEKLVEDTLLQLMSGAVDSLNEQNTALIGGHSSEGAELGFGLSVNGTCNSSDLLTKGKLQTGLTLILSKPLGTGTLFAANMIGKAQGRWIDNALTQMLISNRQAAQIIHAHKAAACTDITGFGLLGHIAEMINATKDKYEVKLQLSSLPILEGAEQCIEEKHLSSLHPENIRSESELINPQQFNAHKLYPILFDPQTAGGLLAAVPAENAQACLEDLRQGDSPDAQIIGEIRERTQPNNNNGGSIRLY